MRALIVSPAYTDPERRAKLRALAGLGCEITVALPGGSGGVDGALRLVGIPARGNSAAPERQVWSRRALGALLRDLRPDVVQVETEPETRVSSQVSITAERLAIPLIAFSWQSVAREWSWAARRRRRAVLGRAAGVIGGNTLAEALLRSAAPAAAHATIPQFATALPEPVPGHQGIGLALGCIGRLIPERGVDQLLQALNHVVGPWSLTVLGTGPEQEMLEGLAQRYGQASRVRWMGGAGREALERLWTEIDVLVVPSRATAGWVERDHPVLMDAMARGIAVVVMDTGALPELVGEAGMVGRDAESLGMALQTLLAHPERRRELGWAGRQRIITTFSDVAIAERTLAFWHEVRGRGLRPPGAG